MEKETARIEAFSDGIFAVAITLLALEIGIDETPDIHITNAGFWNEIIALWPKYFAFFNSFASVLLMWMSHHKIFNLLKSTNTFIILANGFLLLITALVPFPAKTIGEYIRTDAVSATVIFYNSYSVLMCFAFWLLSFAILKNKAHLLPRKNSHKTMSGIYKGICIGFFCMLAILAISFFSPYIGLALNFLMWIFWATQTYLSEKNEKLSEE